VVRLELHSWGSLYRSPQKSSADRVQQLPAQRLEEAVFTIDADAFFITENTFNVIGKGFSRRKVY